MKSLASAIFSRASCFLRRILSYLNILITEKASEIWIVNGRPSGMATTTNTTKRFTFSGRLLNNLPATLCFSEALTDELEVVLATTPIVIKITKMMKQAMRL
jgi:hypothetical protein